MPRRGRARAPDRLDPNLTPLLDIVLQLITFFMMLIHFGTKIEGETLRVRLPIAPAALPGSDFSLDRLVVAIDATGRLLAADEALQGAAAESWWSLQARLRREGRRILGGPDGELPTLVVIRADKSVAFGVVRKCLVTAQREGFARFSLLVLRESRS